MMNGIIVLFILLFVSLLPALLLYIWFRAKHFGNLPFLLALAAGVLSVLIAALAHNFFPPLAEESEIGVVLFGVLRISLVEELSRLLCLFLLFRFLPIARIPLPQQAINNEPSQQAAFSGAPSGLAAGLGFAAAETIFISVSNLDPVTALLRIFTAALHAACGARIGAALSMNKKQAPAAFILVLTAILTHAVYNFCVINPRLPGVLSALLAVTFLASALLTMSPPSQNSGFSNKPNK